jgi:CheY-like chemotaxis protein
MKSILIVEDENALRDVYVTIFGLENYKVYYATNGKEALEQLPNIQVDVILLDVLMPVMGGFDFLKTANLKEDYPHIKVLMLSNLSDSKTLRQITELGADKYLLKSSVSPTQLVKSIEQLLKS